MAIVERGNVVLRVKDDEVKRYLLQGYNETDGKGNILQRSMPGDIVTLQNLVKEQASKIHAQEDEILALKNQINELQSFIEDNFVEEPEIEEPVVEEPIVEVKSTRRGRPRKK